MTNSQPDEEYQSVQVTEITPTTSTDTQNSSCKSPSPSSPSKSLDHRRPRPEKPSRLLLSNNEVRPMSSNDFLSLMDEPATLQDGSRNPAATTSHYWVRPLQKTKQPSSSSHHLPLMIDNSNLLYLTIPLQCGVTVKCRPQVLWDCPGVLSDLQNDLHQCFQILPRSVHWLIRSKFAVWVNRTFAYGPPDRPKRVSHSTAHHHEGWLLWAHDRPEKAPGIEIYNCWEYRKMRWHWNGCGLILHELCHLLHQYCLGLDCPEIIDAWNRCCANSQYHQVLRRDWAGLSTGDTDMAYGLINAKEWFAELSVAYLSRGYPDLHNGAPSSMDESSPPILSDDVLTRLRQRQRQHKQNQPNRMDSTTTLMQQNMPQRRQPKRTPHCNKFYPFTNQQLQQWDPETYRLMDTLWGRIADWQAHDSCHRRCWPF